jgi:hypothetical protein
MVPSTGFFASAVWPAANRAIFVSFTVEQPTTVFQIGWHNGTVVSGNLDVGIYDTAGTRLVSKGSTAQAGVTQIQLADITNTLLIPGIYFMAMCVDNVTATVWRYSTGSVAAYIACGVQQQAVGVVTLPDPATFANAATAYIPWMTLSTKATI